MELRVDLTKLSIRTQHIPTFAEEIFLSLTGTAGTIVEISENQNSLRIIRYVLKGYLL